VGLDPPKTERGNRFMAGMKDFTKGLLVENPVFVLVLGLCPVLAVTTSVENAVGMGVAATFVLLMSNILVSLLRNFIPGKIRIPAYIVVIASFVTIVELVMHGYAPQLYEQLGIFVPLIVVNCIILGRAEAFASKNTLWTSILDALGMGAGFTIALVVIGASRELLGSNKLLGLEVFDLQSGVLGPLHLKPMAIMTLAPGGFLVLGFIMAFLNWSKTWKKSS
jgi:Na+-translocating ferredoxin:NAD+ oxidoreductase subunit E